MVRRQLVVVLLVASCRGEEAKTAARPPAAAAPAWDAAPARVSPPGEKPANRQAPNEVDRKDAEALLAAWLAAQNGGDFASYQKLYGERFTGVRRSGKKVRRFDRAGWMADRGRMFEKPMTVAAAAVHVMAHGAQTHLFFTQTFEQGSYKDSGRKWMALERGADRGFRVAREEMLDSTLISQQEKELAAARAGPEDEELADGEISGYSLAVEDWVPPNIDEENAAAAALLDDAPVVVADLQMSGCPRGAAWARDVDLPPLPEVGSLPDADEARLRKEMQGETTDDDPDLEVLPVAGDPSRAVVALIGHTADSCETQEEYRIRIYLFTRKGRSWQTTTATAPLASYTYDDSLALAVDADGDGTLDIFTTRGAHRGGDDSDFWRHDIRVFWPPGLGCDGCDGCEGEGCGD